MCIYTVNHKPEHAYCQCPIGLAQCCSHVGGFLFAINSYNMEVMREETATSCTSKKSAWNVPRKMTSEPKPLKDMSFSRPKSLTSQSRDEDDTRVTVLNFDPRHSSQRIPDAGHYLQKMMELKTVFPNTGKFAPISFWFCQHVSKTMFNLFMDNTCSCFFRNVTFGHYTRSCSSL